MPTPFTTKSGVQIGREYTPPQRPYHDRDALRLQDALLGNKPETDWDGIFITLAVIALIAVVLFVTHY